MKKTWQVFLLLVIMTGMGLIMLNSLFETPPELARLVPQQEHLLQAIVEVHPTGKGSHGPWAKVQMQHLTGKIEYLCFLWDCHLPPALANLPPQRAITVWLDHDRIWQLSSGDTMLLSYDQMREGFQQARQRRQMILGPLFLLLLGLTIALLRRKSTSAQA